MSRSASVPTNDPPGTSSVTLRPSFSTACACWCSASMHCSRVGKEPTESQGDKAPIIQSVQVPWAEADVTRVSRQSKASGSRKGHLPARVYQRRQASGEPGLPLLGYHPSMPRPVTDRQAWERELREELPALLADHQRELAATPPENRDPWQIRGAQKRLGEVQTRLAGK
jgi:hypothetical protein